MNPIIAGIDPDEEFDLVERFTSRFGLSGYHRLVLEYLLHGYQDTEISKAHDVPRRRVRECIREVRQRVGAKNRARIIEKFRRFALNQVWI
ncbi:hypothetical protein [Pseudobacteriovorax antillogorgiicola]|uniref:Uncharacterized protein n=1 Tax=Pseudobacteriovorax antillogorgiicola TaxID=1513793 RepID=A0A1Y6CNT9_9BACT|nr:hypothetical protein [Pseudobacteriovorax antillogorgiicola]TCS44234.1 hypothetical protein EDD56_13434 [Pseudobacteriovorax antillogorgiicola]SMF80652.1 hypothetical protein SAMN06296036_13535 [Pseudobacteriovorax antillogorgiicola]